MYEYHKIIIFDGICNLCNAGVNFVIKRDPKGVFRFAPMQVDTAQKLIKICHKPRFDFDTVLLVQNGACHDRSDAILEIIKGLTGFWFLFRIFRFVPKSIRDWVYTAIARNRYRIFGKRDRCMVPNQNVRKRFIES